MAKTGKKKIPKQDIKNEQNNYSVRANQQEVSILGLVSPEIEANSNALKLNPYVALKYFNSEWQCFSSWEI